MKLIQYFINYSMLFIIGFVVAFATIEKKNVFEIFMKGVLEGEKIVLNLFPTWLGLFVSIGMMKSSGFINFLCDKVCSIFQGIINYKEILPLVLLRPISGSTSTAMGIEILKNYGVDTKIGLLTSCIMGSTETTIYVVTLYTSKFRNKNIKPVIVIGLIGDFLCVIYSILLLKLNII